MNQGSSQQTSNYDRDNVRWLSKIQFRSSEHKLKIAIFGLTGTMALVALVANILLAKVLSKVVFGKLGFVIMIAPLLSAISLMGQNIWLLRLIASNKNQIRWKPLAQKAILKSSVIATMLFILVFLWAGYSVTELAIILVIGLTEMVTYLIASCLRGLKRDITALLLVRLIPLFLIGIVCACYLSGYDSSLFVLSLLALGYVVQCIFALLIVLITKDGKIEPELTSQTSSGSIFFYNISTHILLQSDRFVCKMIYGFEGYAIYHAAKIIVRPINLVLEMMDYYSLPRLATPPYAKKVKRLIYESIIIATFLGIAYALGGNILFKYLFGNKFGSHRFLILSLALLELIALIQVPLANFIQASGRNRQLFITGFVVLASLMIIWTIYIIANKVIFLPMAVLPLCLCLVYIIKAFFIWNRCKESFRGGV